MLVYAVISDGTEQAVELFVRRDDAERFLETVLADASQRTPETHACGTPPAGGSCRDEPHCAAAHGRQLGYRWSRPRAPRRRRCRCASLLG
ncbi:MAG TPA: hypothetical protein VHF67_05160 [Gaiellaceae bacterium]|nr:hypothetical protein [Gaiellaceae bacterium]